MVFRFKYLRTTFFIVTSNVHTGKFGNGKYLEHSEDFDSITGVLAADVNWDGSNELLVTTFGQQLLVYKQGISSLTLNFHFVKLESLLFQQNLAHPVILNLVRATPTSFHDLYMQQDVRILPAMAWQK